jgi:putative Mg2+ transporter-C (MgtC) family protein
VRGLTTAATVWVTASLGVACALSSWPIIAMGTLVTLAILILPRRIAKTLGKDFADQDD